MLLVLFTVNPQRERLVFSSLLRLIGDVPQGWGLLCLVSSGWIQTIMKWIEMVIFHDLTETFLEVSKFPINFGDLISNRNFGRGFTSGSPVVYQSGGLQGWRCGFAHLLTSYYVYLVEKCAIQLFVAICCNSCWDHSCNARCVVFRTYRHLIEGHCATCGLQLVLVSVTRPGSNLCMPLASVYIIGFSCFSRIEDQETSCIWSNSHSTFPAYLSWIVVSCEINQNYHDIGCRNGDIAYGT